MKGIGEIHIVRLRHSGKGRISIGIIDITALHPLVEDSSPTAECGLAVPEDIHRKAYPWADAPVIILHDTPRKAVIAQDRKAPLFRTTKGRSGELTADPLLQLDVWRMIRRRALAAGIKTEIGCHTFRATGITAYLKNGGRLEVAQQMANHESSRTTGLYDRRSDEVSLDEVERIGI